MDTPQLLITLILLATVAMFLWGRWRHDMVALGALLACVVAGLVSADIAFSGFGHPAVITVACVLVLSQALQSSGAVDALLRYALPGNAGPALTIAAITGIAALLSGFMNNVGALALLMPVALQVANRQGLPPGRVLMPLAFGSILGGMTTMIGTPPNLIVSGFRAEAGADSFAMFDFTPVGLAVAVVGVLFVALVGWRLVPARQRADADSFEVGAYVTEARVRDGSKVVGLSLHDIDRLLEDEDAQVIGLIRNEMRLTPPNPYRKVRLDDILVIEAEAAALPTALSTLGLKLEEAVRPAADAEQGDEEGEEGSDGDPAPQVQNADAAAEAAADGPMVATYTDHSADEEAEARGESKTGAADEIRLMELAVLPQSGLSERSASDIQLRTRYGINLLAISRQGARSMARLRTTPLRAGDVLLMQGPPETILEFASDNGCVPLAERTLRIPNRRKAITASLVMLLAVAGAAFGLLPAAVAFAGGVLASMALRTIPLRSVYTAIDWPVIVLLAALIPVAGALESTGTARLLAGFLLEGVAQGNAVVALVLVLLVTMSLSDLMNNAATAAVMCPIAIGTASLLGASADPFLMAVAVGASCAFLTPIGHQNNTLILGPGGFRFGDYWRLGLPVQILVILVSVPMLLWVWPL